MTSKEPWPVWKTIQLGLHHAVAKEIAEIDPNNHDGRLIEQHSQKIYRLEPDALDILQKPEFTISAMRREAKLVVTSLRSLGLPDGTCYNAIFAAAEKAGLQRCPAEVGLQLRLQYMEQPYRETLVIAMEPILDNDELASVFTVHHGNWGLCLGACCCGISNNEDEWHADSDWVFIVD
jgi:hypothetical protein